jgi:transposase
MTVEKLNEYQKLRMVDLYKSGESATQIARQLQVSAPTVYYWLHRLGVILRESPGSQLRHDAFDELSPEAAYWVGFLFADGSVGRKRRSGPISVRLSERDSKHLVKLQEFLNSSHTISIAPAGNYGGYSSKPSMHLMFTSERLTQQLLSLGRYEGPISDLLIQSRDFWRGVVDGDGSLGILETGYAYFGVVGSRRLLEAFMSFLKSNELGARMTIRADKTIFQVATAGHTAEKIVVFLYRDATVALDRKAASAAKIAAMSDTHLSAERFRLDQERARLAKIAAWYQDGASLQQIGLRLGVSNVTILRWMEQAGIPRRERQGGRRRTEAS